MLTYCTNIHPGEDWVDVLRNLETHAIAVKRAIGVDGVFPLGLRISARAAAQVDAREAQRFADWCQAHRFAVATLNGFPHGRFHGGRVKERVYLPDWRDPERCRYTVELARLLARWLPEGATSSISTVPVAFAHGFERASGSDDWQRTRAQLVAALEELLRIHEERGVEIVLSLEPEPGCMLETSSDAIAFFDRLLLPAHLQRFAGVCFDCCHHAVVYEDLSAAWKRLRDAGVRIGKVQASSAICARGDEIGWLAALDEPTYLHQVVARGADGTLHAFADLPDFLHSAVVAAECRIHFHVPIFLLHFGAFGTTQPELEGLLAALGAEVPVEVETYTFDVIPPKLRPGSIAGCIARELGWAARVLGRNVLHAPRPRRDREAGGST